MTTFIQTESVWLDGNEGQKEGVDTGLEKTPDRRAWKKVSDIMENVAEPGEVHKKLVAGVVGAPAAARFFASITGKNVLTGIEILSDFEKHKKALQTYKLHQLSIVNEGIFRHLEVGEITEEQKPVYAENLTGYYALLESSDNKEAIAHFASCFERGQYQMAILFILDNTPKIYDKLMTFISNL